MKKKILFLCGHNAGRSQMAQAYFNELNQSSEFVGVSAGTNIADELNRACVEAMQEEGVDMNDVSHFFPKVVSEEEKYYRVYSMGCNVKSPVRIDQDLGIEDPAGREIDEVREIRDQVKQKIEVILQELIK